MSGRSSSIYFVCFFFKQKTAYEMRISDWSSDVCSSDLPSADHQPARRPSVSVRAAAYSIPGPGTQEKAREARKNGNSRSAEGIGRLHHGAASVARNLPDSRAAD